MQISEEDDSDYECVKAHQGKRREPQIELTVSAIHQCDACPDTITCERVTFAGGSNDGATMWALVIKKRVDGNVSDMAPAITHCPYCGVVLSTLV